MELEIKIEQNHTSLIIVNETGQRFPETSQRILDFGLLVYQYYTPLIFFFGLVGNSLSILVFLLDPKYRRKSSSYYLIALAVSDSGFLINLLAVWLGSLNNGVITSSFICPLVMYLGQVTCFVTVYLTVSFTIERYIAIYFPLRKIQLCTASNARKIILGILTLALVIFLYVWFIAEVAEVCENGQLSYICAVPNRHHKTSEWANYLDSIFTFIIPLFVITYFNVKIAIKLCQKERSCRSINAISVRFDNLIELKNVRKINLSKLRKRGKDILQVIYIPIAYIDCFKLTPSYDGNKFQHPYLYKHISRLSETRVTKTLLLVSVMFLFLNVPLHVLRCVQFMQRKNRAYLNGIKMTLALEPWAMMLFNTNFAVNFLLYCMSGKGFRNSLRNMFARILFKFFCENKI